MLIALVVALTVSLAPVLPEGAARAATHGRVSVSRSVSSRVVLTGDRVRVSGRVSRAAARTPVRLQRLQRHRWTTLILSRPRTNGEYLFTFTSKVAGTRRLRVLTGRGGRG
ncbi:MAG: hypothetical protein QOF53_2339, partial [Nocardioidaceae bacterium]|nr:hypothetical protein [Nocardioidaceae bacterium]